MCHVNITSFRSLHANFIDIASGCDMQQMCKELLAHAEVQTCEPDYEVELHWSPNDPYFHSCEQWAFEKIDMEAAWEFSRGDSGNTVVGVLDTGARLDHPDLVDALWKNPGIVNGVDTDQNGFSNDLNGWDSVDNDNTPNDIMGHGTHTAGIIGASTNNAVGVSGMSGAKLMILKFIGSAAAGSMSTAQQLLDYAVFKGARVTGMQFGSRTRSANTEFVFRDAEKKNHLIVISAGNAANDNDVLPYFPCSYGMSNVICVGATDQYDNMASFSNYGLTTVDVFAPGHHIVSTYFHPPDPSVLYAPLSGTSMAAPFVAGLASLLIDFKPQLSITDLVKIIVNTADVIPSLKGKAKCGGRINARRAMQAAASGVIPQTCGATIPDVSPTGVVAPTTPAPQYQTVSKLFAIVDSNHCAEWLPYGPSRITEASAAYFSTADASTAHSKWVQKIMPLGVASTGDMEISWTFATAKNLAQRFEGFVTQGEAVTWSIKYGGGVVTKYGDFWFSDSAALESAGVLTRRLQGSGLNFSSDDGGWGAATSIINGNCMHDPNRNDRRKCPTDFWGMFREHHCEVGNPAVACDERQACGRLYKGSMSSYTMHPKMRALMYFETTELVSGGAGPAPAASGWPPTKRCLGYQQVNGVAGYFISITVIVSSVLLRV